MKYLTSQDILIIHAHIIDETGGAHGVRDTHLLMSLAERPKSTFDGKELIQGVFLKTASYFEALAWYHVFIDGNKRTALVASARFLFINGFEFTATNHEAEDFVLQVVVEKLDLKKIAAWFKKHTKKS